jgi:hypothetical protein
MKDLVIVVADVDTEYTLRGLLSRSPSIGIRPVNYDIFRHPHRDPGCRIGACDLLRRFTNQYHRALVVFDHEGCGQEGITRGELERDLESHLNRSGWDDRASVIVIAPELEIWVWSDSPQVDIALGWSGRIPDLRGWLRAKAMWPADSPKPDRPKEAMRSSLREARKGYSAAIFEQLAKTVSFNRCVDPAFRKLLATLQVWFGLAD